MPYAISPEVVDTDLTQPLEDSPMTPSEQRKLVELETRIKTKLGNKMEADLAIGGALLQIQRERLYRGPEGGRKFEEYIKQESHRLTPDGQAIGWETATYLRGFYYFREEVLHSAGHGRGNADLPLPTAARQVRPLLFLLDHLRRDESEIRSGGTYDDRRAAEAKAIDIWKAAVSEAKGKTPTFDQVNRARLADQAAEHHRLRGSASATPPPRPAAPASSVPSAGSSEPPEPVTRSSIPAAYTPSIAAWTLEKDENSLDATDECRALAKLVNDVHRKVQDLRGVLYSKTNKYGNTYLGFLREVDAGVYSISNIDMLVAGMREDLEFIAHLLTADLGPGELAESTLDVSELPTR